MPSIRLRIPEPLIASVLSAVGRLEFTLDVRLSIVRFRRYRFHFWKETLPYSFLFLVALFSLSVMQHSIWLKIFLVFAYLTGILVPLSSQFVLPATPIFGWLLFYYSSQFIPRAWRPHIWVSVLPTLESVLYGANISDILTRYTSSVLDVIAWLPYGVIHFAAPFVVAASLFVFGPPGSVKFFGTAFGAMNLLGVIIQVMVPCAPPWYELREGLTPATYDMLGSPGGLGRIDALFHSNGYTVTFTNSPVIFGAFPSLHAGCATMDALFLQHFFPRGAPFYWGYVAVLFWSTMYLTHHYLVDLTAGGALTVAVFYTTMPAAYREINSKPVVSTDSLPIYDVEDVELGGTGSLKDADPEGKYLAAQTNLGESWPKAEHDEVATSEDEKAAAATSGRAALRPHERSLSQTSNTGSEHDSASHSPRTGRSPRLR